MRNPTQDGRWIRVVRVATVAATFAAVACTSITPERRGEVPLGPEPQLLTIGTFDLPASCQVADGTVYRTSFTVGRDGRVADLRPDPAPACLQSALAAWLASARYAPPDFPSPAVLDWLSTSATRLH